MRRPHGALSYLLMPQFLRNAIDLIRRVFVLARPYGRKKLILVLVFSLAQGIFQVLGVSSIFPFLAVAADPGRLRESEIGRRFFEVLPTMDDGQLLLITGVAAILMLLLSNGVNLAAEINRAHYARHFGHWLRVGLLRKIASRPYADFLNENTGVLMKKVTHDVMVYTTGVLLPMLDSLARLITTILLLATLFVINPKIALGSVLLFGSFYLLVFRILATRRRRISDGIKVAYRGIMRESQQLLGAIKPIKVHRVEEVFMGHFETHSRTEARLSTWMPIFMNGPRFMVEPLAFGAIVLIVLVYSSRGENLVALLPTFGVMALAGYRLLPSLQLFYLQVTSLITSRHALDEIYDEFIAVERSIEKGETDDPGLFSNPSSLNWSREITLQNVSFHYAGSDRPILDQFNFKIPKNAFVGISGQTGSGKSTLVDLILGLHLPTSGSILIDAEPLTVKNRRAWQAGIGYVPQDIFLTDDTLAANIAFGVPREAVDPERLREAAGAAQILDFIEDELPDNWESVVGERGVRLSGGQRQRIGLARALYHRPSLLILDEATSALDVPTETEVMNAIRALKGSVTILIIAHRLSTIEHCSIRLNLGNGPELSLTGEQQAAR